VCRRHQSETEARERTVRSHLETQGSRRWIQDVVLGVGAGAGATQVLRSSPS